MTGEVVSSDFIHDTHSSIFDQGASGLQPCARIQLLAERTGRFRPVRQDRRHCGHGEDWACCRPDPARVRHEGAGARCQRRPTDAARSRVPAPIRGERTTRPPDDGVRRHDLHRPPPVWPDAREEHPEQPIDSTEARSFRGASLQHGELMAERQNFRGELEPRTDRGPVARPAG
jgi:hypothetical protein